MIVFITQFWPKSSTLGKEIRFFDTVSGNSLARLLPQIKNAQECKNSKEYNFIYVFE